MKTILSVGLGLVQAFLLTCSSRAGTAWLDRCLSVVNSNSVTATFGFQGEAPEWVGVVMLTNSPPDSMQTGFDEWHKQVEAARAKWQAELKTNRQAHFKMPPRPSVNDYNALAQWTRFT